MTEDFIKDWEKELERKRQKEEEERLAFLDKCKEKFYEYNDGDFTYQCLVLYTCQRYKLPIDHIPNAAFGVVNYYMDHIDELDCSFDKYVNRNNAPLVRHSRELKKLFPEFDFLDSDKKIIELANKLYDLDLQLVPGYYDEDYIVCFEFDFNKFTPINISEVKSLKEKIRILEEYDAGNDNLTRLYEELNSYGLSEEILELL